jgi:hypothetical protein
VAADVIPRAKNLLNVNIIKGRREGKWGKKPSRNLKIGFYEVLRGAFVLRKSSYYKSP